jgi:hypothetical protein
MFFVHQVRQIVTASEQALAAATASRTRTSQAGALKRAPTVPQTHRVQLDRAHCQTAFAIRVSRGPTAGRAVRARRGSIRHKLALLHAQTAAPARTLQRQALRPSAPVRTAPRTHRLQLDRQHSQAAFAIWGSRGPTAGRAVRARRGSIRHKLALLHAQTAAPARTLQCQALRPSAPVRTAPRTRDTRPPGCSVSSRRPEPPSGTAAPATPATPIPPASSTWRALAARAIVRSQEYLSLDLTG